MTLPLPAIAGTFSSFDVPGQIAVCGAGIADDGTVVGNSTGLSAPVNFLYQNGAITILSVGFTTGNTAVTGINRAHTLVGTNAVLGQNFTFIATGFNVKNGITEPVAVPGATSVTTSAISAGGTLVGSYTAGNTGPTLGYIKRNTTITTLNDGTGDVIPAGIDPTGHNVVGTSMQSGSITAWLYQAGKFTTISPPGTLATFAAGINHASTITGTYATGSLSAPVLHGYFLNKSGKYTTYDVPGASGTQLTGINSSGTATGCYTDSAGTHGLIYKP